MPSIPEAINIAVQHHQAGRLVAAEQIYRQILAVDPNHIDALHLMGVVAHQIDQREDAIEYVQRAIALNSHDASFYNSLGNILKACRKWDEAVAAYCRAIELKPSYAAAHNHLGNTFRAMGKFDEAVASYLRALKHKPDYAEAHNNLGNALLDQKKYEEAAAAYRRALEWKPTFYDAHSNLGVALHHLGKSGEAIAAFQRALELNPQFAGAHTNLGNTFKDLGRRDEAVASYRRSLAIDPHYADAYNGLAIVLHDQGKVEESIANYRRALELRPDYVNALNNLGNALTTQAKLDEAIACFDQVLQLKPDFAEAYLNYGAALREQGEWDQALARFRRSVELMPDFAAAHSNLAFLQLLTGDWQNGLSEHEWRLRMKDVPPRSFSQPLWDGTSLSGKTILLHAEQGLGDTIQFIRFAAIFKRLGATVVVESQPPLLPLLANCPGIDQCIGQGSPLPAHDVHFPLMSVLWTLKTSVDAIPADVPYIHPESALVEQWRERLSTLDGFKIGIHWQGNPKFRFDHFRSIPLRHFAAIGKLPGVRLISLQKGAGTEQLAEIKEVFSVIDLAAELDQQAGPFMDTAAVMKNLDLVITSDTATAHLAGALGVPVWVALQFAPDWRWLLDRLDSPWYPTMRLFRQREARSWEEVFEQIKQALCERLGYAQSP